MAILYSCRFWTLLVVLLGLLTARSSAFTIPKLHPSGLSNERIGSPNLHQRGGGSSGQTIVRDNQPQVCTMKMSRKVTPGPASTKLSLSTLSAKVATCLQVASPVTATISSVLLSGPYGVLGLASIASAVLIPLTQIRNLYAISVGYGMSVGVMGMALRRLFAPTPDSLAHTLSGCTVFYGFRLASYLLLRERAGWKPARRKADPPRLSRIPFSISLGLFYACMTAPVMYVLRSPPIPGTWQSNLAWTGTVLAWIGAILEAVADTHKFLVKNNVGDSNSNDASFAGPTGGVYRFTRHPNYTGEMMHWVGTYLAGAACFQKSIVGWAVSSVGLYGILNIMRAASKGLEERQAEKYGGQDAYETWKKQVKAPLIPFLNE